MAVVPGGPSTALSAPLGSPEDVAPGGPAAAFSAPPGLWLSPRCTPTQRRRHQRANAAARAALPDKGERTALLLQRIDQLELSFVNALEQVAHKVLCSTASRSVEHNGYSLPPCAVRMWLLRTVLQRLAAPKTTQSSTHTLSLTARCLLPVVPSSPRLTTTPSALAGVTPTLAVSQTHTALVIALQPQAAQAAIVCVLVLVRPRHGPALPSPFQIPR